MILQSGHMLYGSVVSINCWKSIFGSRSIYPGFTNAAHANEIRRRRSATAKVIENIFVMFSSTGIMNSQLIVFIMIKSSMKKTTVLSFLSIFVKGTLSISHDQ